MTEKQLEDTLTNKLIDIRKRQRQRRLCNFNYNTTAAVRDIDYLLSLLQQPVTGERCGECGHKRRYYEDGRCRALILSPSVAGSGMAYCSHECVYPATDAPSCYGIRPTPIGESPEMVKCEVLDCNDSQICFHYCQEHHFAICKPPHATIGAREGGQRDGLLRDAGAITCVNDLGIGARVEIRFAELEDAQRLHKALVQMRSGAPATVAEGKAHPPTHRCNGVNLGGRHGTQNACTVCGAYREGWYDSNGLEVRAPTPAQPAAAEWITLRTRLTEEVNKWVERRDIQNVAQTEVAALVSNVERIVSQPSTPTPGETASDLREELAALCHRQWSGWMRYLFYKCETENLSWGTLTKIPEAYAQRWRRQAETSYADLPEEEKESDRKEADRLIEVLSHHFPPTEAAQPTAYMHEDELPADMPKEDYDKWYEQSWIPNGVGCRVGPRYPFESAQVAVEAAAEEIIDMDINGRYDPYDPHNRQAIIAIIAKHCAVAPADAGEVERPQPTEDFERAYFCAVRALRHLKQKNHNFIPLECDGCKEVALFLTEPGYRGDEHNPIGADCERSY